MCVCWAKFFSPKFDTVKHNLTNEMATPIVPCSIFTLLLQKLSLVVWLVIVRTNSAKVSVDKVNLF